jgi:ribonuclease HI
VVDFSDKDVFIVDAESPWKFFFDGVSHIDTYLDGAQRRRVGVSLVFKTPQDETIYHFFSLIMEEYSNNEVEYEALIFDILLTLFMDIQNLLPYGDSQLIIQ